jgi:flagellar hook-length control protein FliK
MVNFIQFNSQDDFLSSQTSESNNNKISGDGGFKKVLELFANRADRKETESVENKTVRKATSTNGKTTSEDNLSEGESEKTATINSSKIDKKLEKLTSALTDSQKKAIEDMLNKIELALGSIDIPDEVISAFLASLITVFNKFEEDKTNVNNLPDFTKLMTEAKEKFSVAINKLNSNETRDKAIKTLNEVFDKLTLSSDKNLNQTTNTNDSKTFIEQIKQMKPEKENNIKSDIEALFKTAIKEAVKSTDNSTGNNMDKQNKNDSNSSMFKFDMLSFKNDSNQSQPVQTETRQLDVKSMADILKVVDIINAAKDSGVKKLTVQLTPEHLGKLEIHLTETAGKISAKIFTDNDNAKYMLLNSSDQIRNQLESKGIVIENMEFGFMMANDDKNSKQDKQNDGNFKNVKIKESNTTANKQVSGLYA